MSIYSNINGQWKKIDSIKVDSDTTLLEEDIYEFLEIKKISKEEFEEYRESKQIVRKLSKET
jgi:hypothetical protein